jgi:hypothetical protein
MNLVSRILSEAEKLHATSVNLQVANSKLALIRTLARDILMEYDNKGSGGSTPNGQWKALREISKAVDLSTQAMRVRVVQTSQHSSSSAPSEKSNATVADADPHPCPKCKAAASKRDTAISALKMLWGWLNVTGIGLPDGIEAALEKIVDGELEVIPCPECAKLRIFLQRVEKRMDFFEKAFLMDSYRELWIDLRRILEEVGDVGSDEEKKQD